MSNIMKIALSGLRAFDKKLEVTANNTANVNTDGFKKSRATLAETYPEGVKVTISGVDTPGTPLPAEETGGKPLESANVNLEEEMVDLILTRHFFDANAKIIKVEDEMTGELINIKA
ncbi:MAG: flagellar basal body protein [Deltaproteobacteria bacterium]|nr:flagellar basal body protein [Deltaproteobacteria bacterium]